MGFRSYFLQRQNSRLTNQILIVMLVGAGYISLFTYIGVLKGVSDLNFIKEYVMGFILFFSAHYIVIKYRMVYRKSYIDYLMKHLFYVGVIHAAIILVSVVSNDFKDLLYHLVYVTPKQQKYIFGNVFNNRYSGLMPVGFSSLSVTHAILLSFGFYNLWKMRNNLSLLTLSIYSFCMTILSLSLLYIGRSGIIVFFCYSITLLFLLIFRTIKTGRLALLPFKLLLLVGFVVFLVLLIIDYEKHIYALVSSFEFIFRYLYTGNLSTYSTDIILESELVFPEGLALFF